jgi:predicted DNA-binding transcriptional regulator AlpA
MYTVEQFRERAAPVELLGDCILTKADVSAITGRHPETLRSWERQGRFPKRVVLGATCVGWLKSEVTAWLQAVVADRDAG